MVNWKNTIQKNDIPIEVNYLKHLMSDCLPKLNNTHYLKNLLSLYETWQQKGMPDPIPNDIILLACHAKSIKSFRSDYNDPKVRKHLVHKLCNANMVHSILYEFRSCVHFDFHHKRVNWLPNISNVSEADLRIERNDGDIFYVECVSKMAKNQRMDNFDIVKADIKLTLGDKKKQSVNLQFPRLVSIFFPENINLDNMDFRTELGRDLEKLFEDPEYNVIAAVCIVSNSPPQFVKKKNDFVYYDTDFISLSYPNPNAKYKLRPEAINPGGL